MTPTVKWTTRGVGKYQVAVRLPGANRPLLALGSLGELQQRVDRLLAAWGVGAGIRALGEALERDAAERKRVADWLGRDVSDWPTETSNETTLQCPQCKGKGCLFCQDGFVHQRIS